jgi:hypothetical protein
MKSYKFFVFITIPLIILLSYILYTAVRTDNNENIPPAKFINATDTFHLRPYITSLSPDSLVETFPYNTYLEFANYENVNSIKKDLDTINAVFPSANSLSMQILSDALTEKLFEKNFISNNDYKPDSLLYLFYWAERFKNYAEVDQKNKLLFESIYGYWIQKISNKLTYFSEQDDKIKFDFKFKYLVAKCNENTFTVSLKVSKTDKFLYNLLGNHWAHLIEASWQAISVSQIIIFTIIILTTLLTYLFSFIKFLEWIKEKNSK